MKLIVLSIIMNLFKEFFSCVNAPPPVPLLLISK